MIADVKCVSLSKSLMDCRTQEIFRDPGFVKNLREICMEIKKKSEIVWGKNFKNGNQISRNFFL